MKKLIIALLFITSTSFAETEIITKITPSPEDMIFLTHASGKCCKTLTLVAHGEAKCEWICATPHPANKSD